MLIRKKVLFAVIGAAVAIAIALAFYLQRFNPVRVEVHQPPVKLTLAMNWHTGNANIFIARQMGYFRDEGLDVTLLPTLLGKQALAELLGGRADLAVAAVTPIIVEALAGKRFRVLATLYESGIFVSMIGRRDRGITKPSDLAGKRLGVPFGTNAEFIQDTILALYKVDRKSIVRFDLAPGQMVDALMTDKIDAVTTWAPYTLELIQRLGKTAVVFSDEAMFTQTFNLITREALVKQHPAAIRQLLAALLRADALVHSDPVVARRALMQESGLDATAVTANWNPQDFTVMLNQSLVVSMEDQAHWAIQRGLVKATEVPNFSEWIDANTLAALKPEAVNLIR